MANAEGEQAAAENVKPDSQTRKGVTKPTKSTDPEAKVKTPKGAAKAEKASKPEGGPEAAPRVPGKTSRLATSGRRRRRGKRQARSGSGRKPGTKPYPVVTFEQAPSDRSRDSGLRLGASDQADDALGQAWSVGQCGD